MGQATSFRNAVKNLINKLGSTAYVYSFDAAAVTDNDEGDETITWSTATSVKIVSAGNKSFARLIQSLGVESDRSGRSFVSSYENVIGAKDKIIVDGVAYMVDEVKKIDPIENTLIAYRIMLVKNERYTV